MVERPIGTRFTARAKRSQTRSLFALGWTIAVLLILVLVPVRHWRLALGIPTALFFGFIVFIGIMADRKRHRTHRGA